MCGDQNFVVFEIEYMTIENHVITCFNVLCMVLDEYIWLHQMQILFHIVVVVFLQHPHPQFKPLIMYYFAMAIYRIFIKYLHK